MIFKRCCQIYKVPEFNEWFLDQSEKSRVQIDDRLSKIQYDGHFGDHKLLNFEDAVWELRWKNGRRVYYTYIPEDKILVLLGGNKNGQDKDIRKATSLSQKYTTEVAGESSD